ncbi:hypothetical protein D9M71_366220 [compost metagenome]
MFSEQALELKRQEHAALVEVILARDAKRASAMMRSHLMTPVPIIAQIMHAEGIGAR